MKKGDSGSEVKEVQEMLNEAGFGPLMTDGDYGELTHRAVIVFQKAHRLTADGVAGPITLNALKAGSEPVIHIGAYDSEAVLAVMRNKGYIVREDGQMNIVGIRSAQMEANAFDDVMYFIRKSPAGWESKAYRVTTDPGTFWLTHPMRKEGTAIVAPGQYPQAYKFGMHRGQYKTLCQTGARIKVFRDSNRDDILDVDENSIMDGYFGCNIHKAGTSSTSVDKWSAGCQVFARKKDWSEAMESCLDLPYSRFDYTLLVEEDFSPVIG